MAASIFPSQSLASLGKYAMEKSVESLTIKFYLSMRMHPKIQTTQSFSRFEASSFKGNNDLVIDR